MSVSTEIERLQNAKAEIKSAIEEKGVEVGDGRIDTYAEKISQITSGDGGYDEGYEAGKQAEYDRFWDSFQQNGTRRNYPYGFAGSCWKDDTYNPKYEIIITNMATSTFAYNSSITSTKKDITVDTATSSSFFVGCTRLKEIPSIKVTEKVVFSSWFSGCKDLETINFTTDSVIANNISFADSTKLTHESLMSIINALKNFRLVNSTYSNVTYSWNGTEGDGEIGKVYECGVPINWGDKIEFQCTWGDYETDYHVIVLNVRNLNITDEELEKVKTFMIDSNGNLVLGIQQETPTTTKTLTLHADSKALLTDSEKAIATQKGWTIA